MRVVLALRLSLLWFCIGICVPALVFAQSGTPAEQAATKAVPPDVLSLSADFEGAIDDSVGTAYFCKGKAAFIAAPTSERPDNKALLLTLDPKATSSVGRCEPPNASSERTELAEPDAMRLPLGTETWYGLRFLIPSAMKGKLAGERLVIAQLKQHPETCPLGPQPLGSPAHANGNPTVSLRVIEDEIGDVMGLQLAVSGDRARKISVGQLMRHRDGFLDRWHEVLLHVKVMPPGERPNEVGFVEGWLDGQPFANGLYGVLDGKGGADPMEPFGYAGLVGCTYFKYGIYRDRQAEPWTIAFDRFRRGASREEIEAPGH
jgi:Polysaccharide lyase